MCIDNSGDQLNAAAPPAPVLQELSPVQFALAAQPSASTSCLEHSAPTSEEAVRRAPSTCHGSRKSWPLVYTLPTVPARIHEGLRRASSLVDLDQSTERCLVRVLFEDMVQYTLLVFPFNVSVLTRNRITIRPLLIAWDFGRRMLLIMYWVLKMYRLMSTVRVYCTPKNNFLKQYLKSAG
jgi:hypothetical protein